MQLPVRQVAENAGNDGSIVIGKLLDSNDLNRGFDTQSGEYVDMIRAGERALMRERDLALHIQRAVAAAYLLGQRESDRVWSGGTKPPDLFGRIFVPQSSLKL